MSTRKALAVMDVQQLFVTARKEFGPLARLDFVRLKETIMKMTTARVDFVAYTTSSPIHSDSRFIKFLKSQGFNVFRRFAKIERNTNDEEDGPTIRVSNNSWTAEMVWDTGKSLPYYDEIFIVSGSGRFCRVVDAAHDQGKRVTVMTFRMSLFPALKERADKVVILDQQFLYEPPAKEPVPEEQPDETV